MATKPPFNQVTGAARPTSNHATPTPPPPPKKPAPTPADPYGGLSGASRDAAVALTNMFNSYGLGSLAPKILDFIKQGYSPDTISILLQDTSEYKQRFAANDARRKAGLPVLSPADYLSAENSYRELFSQAGLPPGFYDQTSDFTTFIANGVSPLEMQQRVQVAKDMVYNSDPATLAYFRQHYSTGDLVAYTLDPKRAAPLIENQYKAAQVGGAANSQGLNVSQAQIEALAKQGVSIDQARQGFGFVKDNLDTTQRLDAIYGGDVTQNDLVAEVFQNDSTATQKRAKLASQERGAFGGRAGLTKNSMAQGTAGAV